MKENSIEENKNSNFSIEAKFESMIKMAREIINQNKENTGDCSIKTALAYDVAAYLSDYKRVLKENEELKDTNCLVKRYFKLKDTNTYLQKENEELKQYLITQNCEINRLNLDKIRLELLQVPDTTEQYKYLKNEYKMRLERTDLENYKLNYISIQKVKDKIEELKSKSGGNVFHIQQTINAEVRLLQELLEERKLEEDKL